MSRDESTMGVKRHELYEEIMAHVQATLVEFGSEIEVAEQAAVTVVNHLANHWGGSTFSFPKDSQLKIAQRDLEIYSKYKGHNHRALAKEYDLTENAIYRIVKRVQRQYVKERQPDMFEST